MPDWSGVRDVKPDMETQVRLYDKKASDPAKGRFLKKDCLIRRQLDPPPPRESSRTERVPINGHP